MSPDMMALKGITKYKSNVHIKVVMLITFGGINLRIEHRKVIRKIFIIV